MKRREIDYFGIVIGLVIGALFGYFLSLKINYENTDVVNGDGQEGNVYLLQIIKSDNINSINSTLSTVDFNYEIIEDNKMFYVYTAISLKKEELENKKDEYANYGFNPVIRSEYIIDWSDKFANSQDKKTFYNEAINNLFNSLNNKTIIISEKYYDEPIDFEVFSNLTILQAIKNQKIKEQIELELFHQLFKKLN